MITDVAVAGAAFTGLTALLTWLTLIRRAKVQYMTSMLYLHEYLASQDLVRARRNVRTRLRWLPLDQWSEQDLLDANVVCASYDQAGLLINHSVVNSQSRDIFLTSTWGESICDQYEYLQPFLRQPHGLSRSGQDYFREFKQLYRHACVYHRVGEPAFDEQPATESRRARAQWSRSHRTRRQQRREQRRQRWVARIVESWRL